MTEEGVQPPVHRYLGVMSGTSMDGLDLALIEVAGKRVTICQGTTVHFPTDLHVDLQRVARGSAGDHTTALDSLGAADCELGRFIGMAAMSFLRSCDLGPDQISAIGNHAQTVRHRPDGSAPFSLQIGDPNQIAEITGITTVADLRRRDIAAGGQGAPLVPAFHAVLFPAPAVIVNIGGIGNITLLPDSDHAVTGFDTGPGNALMDAWVQRHRQHPYDDAGAWASSGQVDVDLLDQMLKDPYFFRAPPKSTGTEYFNNSWIDAKLAGKSPAAPADVQATLAALTARSIADSITAHGGGATVIVCGGGRLNTHLMELLRLALPGRQVTTSEHFGYDGDWIEAAAFAWLAHRAMSGLPGNEPGVTGARGPRVLGAIYPGS